MANKMKIKTFDITISGATMLMNRLSKDLMDEIKKVPKGQLDDYEDNNYLKKLYGYEIDEGKTILVPPEVIYGFLQSCSKKYPITPPANLKVGRTWTNYVKGSIVVNDVKNLEYASIKPYPSMVNGNPSSSKGGSKVYKVRPLITDWKLSFSIQDIGGYLKQEVVEGILTNGGILVGFGDFRPMFGRYKVNKVIMKEVEL